MCCCNYKFAQLATPLLLRLSFNPPPPPPQFVFFRVRPLPGISIRSSSFNDAVSTMPYDQPATCFYELLGIPQTGSLLEIKQAYKQLARKYHPDVSPPGRVEEYTRTFIRVQEAYETLSDPTTRELYDRHKAKGIHLAFTARRRNKFQQVSLSLSLFLKY
ncbi:J domain-containing protein [Acinetobacter baumannii]